MESHKTQQSAGLVNDQQDGELLQRFPEAILLLPFLDMRKGSERTGTRGPEWPATTHIILVQVIERLEIGLAHLAQVDCSAR